ncbi:hypothetical protein Slin15195_G082090 [Septoria linicola]|uniref:Uncharacterized protein n=1 Tax=Septoria linicola TaxID=215465 RepID=A0A9Q9ATJ9_9PEZI|nr:hypothetical protein Slin15195_G082090 [Septoria linicola]
MESTKPTGLRGAPSNVLHLDHEMEADFRSKHIIHRFEGDLLDVNGELSIERQDSYAPGPELSTAHDGSTQLPSEDRVREDPDGPENSLNYQASYAERLHAVIQTAPTFLSVAASQPPPASSASSDPGVTTGVSGSISDHSSQAPAGPNVSQAHGLPTLGHGAAISGTNLYLGVARGTDHLFPCIAIKPQMTDRECFSKLREQYLSARGFLRQWFSIWRFDHCELYQFRKYAIGTGEPAKLDYPLETDSKYDFNPKPISPGPPIGPIAEREFRDYFYKHCEPCNFVNRSWKRLIQHRILNTPIHNSAIQVLPKRLSELHFDDGNREAFGGLYAIERISFAWVAAYFCLVNAPSVVYFFLWLFYWRHDSDVQGASVPVSLSLTLTAMFIGLVLASKK